MAHAHSVPLVEITRGDAVENLHRGTVAVVDAAGTIVASAGDPNARIYVRSAAKPVAAAVVVASRAADAHALSDAELALIAGSHSGTDADVAGVRSMLRKADATEGDLRNGSAAPDDAAAAAALTVARRAPSTAHQMCSGEHAGLLLLARHSGWPTDRYWERQHPGSLAVEQLLARLSGVPDLDAAFDDCGLPTYRLPLSAIARTYALLGEPGAAPEELADVASSLDRTAAAMTREPERVGGAGLLDTETMRAAGGRIVAKEGAAGLTAFGVRGGAALGIAVSVEDGDPTRRASAVATVAVLTSLGLIDERGAEAIRASRDWPDLADAHGRIVGEARAVFTLR